MTDRRQWKHDGEMRNARDAHQMIEEYRAAYTAKRARRLVEMCLETHGHPEEIKAVLREALDTLEW